MKRFMILVFGLMVFSSTLTIFAQSKAPWWSNARNDNEWNSKQTFKRLTTISPIPEIQYGMERKMVAWRATTFDTTTKMGYVYVFCSGVGAIGYYVIVGKVASLNSYMAPEDERADCNGAVVEAPDIDGTYGHNIEGVFFRTTSGAYVELSTNGPLGYMYYDQPIPVLKIPCLGSATPVTK
jgi:hypothetical protein